MKKLFSAVLAAALCLMIPVSVAAAGIDEMTSRESLFAAEVESKVADVLVAVELQKDDFGLENVDFSRLALGNEFPSYELTENGLVLIEDIHYFPTWITILGLPQRWFLTALTAI